MIIYKDLISGDELLTDSYKIREVDDIVYEVDGKVVTVSDSLDEAAFGFNPSAEGGEDEGADGMTSTSGINVVLAHNLVETGFTKKTYQTYIKKYMKTIKDKLSETKPERVEIFMAKIQPVIKKILGSFDDYQFFLGESSNAEGMAIPVTYLEDGLSVVMTFFKDGLDEEKA